MPEAVYPGLDDPIPPQIRWPDPEQEVTERYEQADTGPLDGVPLFRVVHSLRHPLQTEEQHLMSRMTTEEYYLSLSASRHIAHIVADELGFPARCSRPACRRARACVCDRHEFDWAFPGPWMPPCAATRRLIEQVRVRVRAYIAAAERGQLDAP